MVRRAFPSRGRALLSHRGSDRGSLLRTVSFAPGETDDGLDVVPPVVVELQVREARRVR